LRRKSGCHFVVEALNDRDHSDYGRYSDNYADEGKGSSQLVCAQACKGYEKRFEQGGKAEY
jgi:hypothetical protein